MTTTLEEKHTEIWKMIKSVKTGMLTTLDGEDLRARPMQVVQEAYEGTLWFFTSKDSAKVYEAQSHREVNVCFVAVDKGIYLSLSGKAYLNYDQERIDALWNKNVELWFPKGKEGPNVALLEIDIYKGELWNVNESGLKKLYETAKAKITDKRPDIGRKEEFRQ